MYDPVSMNMLEMLNIFSGVLDGWLQNEIYNHVAMTFLSIHDILTNRDFLTLAVF